ncbi:MAG: ThuA domain-containing protein [Owenweeksia sp.]|nr:ThuA domain-containing protein [Owenweeksia sp.]
MQNVLPGSGGQVPGNKLPSVQLSGVNQGDTLSKASLHSLMAQAGDPDGTVDSIRFSINGQTLAWRYSAPYQFDFIPDTTGSFTLRATAFDNLGDSLVSTGIQVFITDDNFFRILHYTETSGFDHNTRSVSYDMLQKMGYAHGFQVINDQTGQEFDALQNLHKYAVVIFSNTSGNQILNSQQQQNFEAYMNRGGAFIGIHAASDSYRHSSANGANTGDWDWFAQMLGASVQNSPNHTAANYNGTLDQIGVHPTTVNLPNPWSKMDEYYYWESGYYDSLNIPVLQVQSTGAQSYDSTRPMSWYKYLPNGGRSFYTALGHDTSSYQSDTNFINHIRDAIFWSVNNQIPLVNIGSPSPNDTIILGDTLQVTATANDPDGSVDSVGFRLGNTLLGWDYAAPWRISHPTKKRGNFSLQVIAYDNEGEAGHALPVAIFVHDTVTYADTLTNYAYSIPENEDYDFFVGEVYSQGQYIDDTLDNQYFYLKDDSLFTNYSFNFEAALGARLKVAVNTISGIDIITVGYYQCAGQVG